jgi:hypothetical protein
MSFTRKMAAPEATSDREKCPGHRIGNKQPAVKTAADVYQ